MSYIDTSVIIAALDPRDHRMERARDIIDKEENKVVSEMVLAELASVISRRRELLSRISDKLGLSREETIIALLIYILKRFDIKYKIIGGSSRYPLLGKIYKPIATAIELSTHVKLRTLDLLHLAYAKLIKDEGEAIRKIITADNDFAKNHRKIKEITDLDLQVIT